ncbi:MAG: exodeoxyribonuclease III [Alphaproteobacteria bacterium]|nr:exodeoxyribonuclease III [Alphaproteobacteria bacterium]
MKIATYNVNSIKARANNFFDWLKKENFDIIFLQEIKCETENFLYFECESLGYKVAVLGQKGYNGVAILCKYDFKITNRNLPNFRDEQARYLEILINKENEQFYAISVYVPNGCGRDKESEKEKLAYKLKWLDKLYLHTKNLLNSGIPIIMAGDFNVMLEDIDVYNEESFKNSPLYIKEVKNEITALKYLGLKDCFRLLHKNTEGYTFWDYTANSFVTNLGLRIDYIFISAFFEKKLNSVYVDKTLRQMEKPSDHTPLVAEFKD